MFAISGTESFTSLWRNFDTLFFVDLFVKIGNNNISILGNKLMTYWHGLSNRQCHDLHAAALLNFWKVSKVVLFFFAFWLWLFAGHDADDCASSPPLGDLIHKCNRRQHVYTRGVFKDGSENPFTKSVTAEKSVRAREDG